MSRFKPVRGQYYYMINSRFKVVRAQHTGSKKSDDRIASGNAFKKQLQAYIVLATLKGAINKKWWEFWK